MWPRFGWAWREGSQVGNAKCSKLTFEHQKRERWWKIQSGHVRSCKHLAIGCIYTTGKQNDRPTSNRKKWARNSQSVHRIRATAGWRHSFASTAKWKRSCSIKLGATQKKTIRVCTSPTNLKGYMVSRHVSFKCCIFKISISQNLSSTCLTAVFMSNSHFSLCRCLCDGIECYCHVTIGCFTFLCVHPNPQHLTFC